MAEASRPRPALALLKIAVILGATSLVLGLCGFALVQTYDALLQIEPFKSRLPDLQSRLGGLVGIRPAAKVLTPEMSREVAAGAEHKRELEAIAYYHRVEGELQQLQERKADTARFDLELKNAGELIRSGRYMLAKQRLSELEFSITVSPPGQAR